MIYKKCLFLFLFLVHFCGAQMNDLQSCSQTDTDETTQCALELTTLNFKNLSKQIELMVNKSDMLPDFQNISNQVELLLEKSDGLKDFQNLSKQTQLLTEKIDKLENLQNLSKQMELLSEKSDKLHEYQNLSKQMELLSEKSDKIQDMIQSAFDKQKDATQFGCDLSPEQEVLDDKLPENCADIFSQGYTTSGIYTIYEPFTGIHSSLFRSDRRRSLNVYCDMERSFGGPGWMIFHRRSDGTVNFTQNWSSYRDGFGNLTGEHWLGNENLNIITSSLMAYELRIELGDWIGGRRYARYKSFQVLSEDLRFQLVLGNYTAGDAGNSFSYHNNCLFSTVDLDNDNWQFSCAQKLKAGFWFNRCLQTCLTCPYYNVSGPDRSNEVSWNAWRGTEYSLKFVEMKLRPVPYNGDFELPEL